MTTRPAHAPALDGATLTFTSNHPYIHTHTRTHDGFIQTTLWTSCLEILSSLWEVLLRFSSYLLYRCLLRLWGPQSSERSYAVSGSFLTCGMMLLETKWILFMWAQLQRAWPRACPRPGSALLCSGLATKCVSLSCGPWPPDAFPDPGNRINTSARALGSHSRIHSCPLTRPSPVQSDPASCLSTSTEPKVEKGSRRFSLELLEGDYSRVHSNVFGCLKGFSVTLSAATGAKNRSYIYFFF